jgi:hypothetical protein
MLMTFNPEQKERRPEKSFPSQKETPLLSLRRRTRPWLVNDGVVYPGIPFCMHVCETDSDLLFLFFSLLFFPLVVGSSAAADVVLFPLQRMEQSQERVRRVPACLPTNSRATEGRLRPAVSATEDNYE